MTVRLQYVTAFQQHNNLPKPKQSFGNRYFRRTSINLHPRHGSINTSILNPVTLHTINNNSKRQSSLSKLYLSPASSITSTAAATTAAVLPSAAFLKVTKIMSLLPHQSTFYVLSSILILSSFGIILEKRTAFGKALSVRIYKW